MSLNKTIETELARISELTQQGDFESALDCAEALLEHLRQLLRPIVDEPKTGGRSPNEPTYVASRIPGGFGRVKNIERLVAQTVSVLISGQQGRARESAAKTLAEWRDYSPTQSE